MMKSASLSPDQQIMQLSRLRLPVVVAAIANLTVVGAAPFTFLKTNLVQATEQVAIATPLDEQPDVETTETENQWPTVSIDQQKVTSSVATVASDAGTVSTGITATHVADEPESQQSADNGPPQKANQLTNVTDSNVSHPQQNDWVGNAPVQRSETDNQDVAPPALSERSQRLLQRLGTSMTSTYYRIAPQRLPNTFSKGIVRFVTSDEPKSTDVATDEPTSRLPLNIPSQPNGIDSYNVSQATDTMPEVHLSSKGNLTSQVATDTRNQSSVGESRRPVLQPTELVFANETLNNGPVAFLVDRKIIVLKPGKSRVFPTGTKRLIRFDRGGGFGQTRQTLTTGVYHFVATDEGWYLQLQPQN